MAVMNPAPAVALLRDGTRVVLSDPLDEARRHWRDGEYDTDVVAIELSDVVTDVQTVATNWPSATVQLALL